MSSFPRPPVTVSPESPAWRMALPAKVVPAPKPPRALMVLGPARPHASTTLGSGACQRHVAVAVVVQGHAALADIDRVRARGAVDDDRVGRVPERHGELDLGRGALDLHAGCERAALLVEGQRLARAGRAGDRDRVGVRRRSGAAGHRRRAELIAPLGDAERRLLARSDHRRHGSRRRVVDARAGGRRRRRRAVADHVLDRDRLRVEAGVDVGGVARRPPLSWVSASSSWAKKTSLPPLPRSCPDRLRP